MTYQPFVHGAGDDGPALFCLHGLLGSGTQFDGLEPLTDRYRIQAWDAPGYGNSPDPEGDQPLEWYAAQAALAIERSDSAPVHLLGTGWGGLIAMQLAATRTDLVCSVLVVNSCLGPTHEQQKQLQDDAERLRLTGAEEFGREQATALTGGDETNVARQLADGLRATGYAAAARSLDGVDLTSRLRGIQLPVLVLAGEDATPDAVQASQDVSAAIGDAVFVTMHAAGSLAHLEQPSTFAAWVRSFLYIVDRVREETR